MASDQTRRRQQAPNEGLEQLGIRSWRAVSAVASWQTAASLCYFSIFAATSYFRASFGLSRTAVGLLTATAILGYTLNLVPSGAAVDGFGERRVMIVGLGGLGMATLAIGLAPGVSWLFLAAFGLGTVYATAMPASNRGISRVAPAGRENSAMGIKQVGVTAGSGAASLLIAGVALRADWRWGFGLIAVIAGVAAVGFGLRYRGGDGTGEWTVPDLGSLRANRAYLLLVAGGLFLGAAVFTTVAYTLLYADEAVGLSVALAGVVLAGLQATGSLGRIGAGALADRIGGGRGAASLVAIQVGAGTVLLAGLALGPGSAALSILLLLGVGISIVGSTGVFYSTMTAIVETEEIGAATAGGQTAINVGGLVGPPAFGFLADTVSYEAGWALLAGVGLIATLLFVALLSR